MIRVTRSKLALLVVALLAVGCSNASSNQTPIGRGAAPQSNTTPGGSTRPAPVGNTLTAKLATVEVGRAVAPVAMTARPGSNTLYVAEQAGRIRTLKVAPDGKSGQVDDTPLLDISSEVDGRGERGLLGLAFAADGKTLYAYFTDKSGRIHLISHRMNGDALDTASRTELLSLQHDRPNHNGGQLALGPDGYLYLGVGDGGGGGDPDQNGQNPKTLYGKLLRIDPTKPANGKPYGIPADNPFADGKDGAPEVWLYGARNPWRFSFDRVTGDLWIGDVGQNEVEEIDLLPSAPGGAGKGANLGWVNMEGTRPYKGGSPPPNHTPPIFEYNHDNGECSVISGFAYRGKAIPQLAGVVPYTDFCVGEVRGLLSDGAKLLDEAPLGVKVESLSSFGQDNDGEQYALSLAGKIYRLTGA